MNIRHNEPFEFAFRFVTETNQNVFLTGKAGTGKTTFLQYLRQNSIKKIIIAAPTGVAAVNAGGTTLHSLFQLPLGIILPSTDFNENYSKFKNHPLLSKIHYTKEKLELLSNIELLIIDEISMASSYILDAIDTILRYVRKTNNKPFGGVQLLLIGDLYQLPPVIKRDEWEILKNFYNSIFFFDSLVLRENPPVIIEFKEIFRQSDNKFIEILNGIRNNDITEDNFNLLNSRLRKNFIPNNNDGYIILTTHNYQSDQINKQKLNELPNRSYIFNAEINGDFPEHLFPAEKELELKVGAQVMFLRNDTEEKLYFNGKLGIITKLDDNSIKVKCKDLPYEIEVKKYEWKNIRYKINTQTREISEEITGTFIQYPLRLAWAITIHKSQGLTFDKVIIDAEKAFAMGQAYVALSRCTSLEGLVLKSPIYKNFLGAHEELIEWENANNKHDIINLFNKAREEYILQELQEIFNWDKWHQELNDFYELILLNQNKISTGAISWLEKLISKQKQLAQYALKLMEFINNKSEENYKVEENNFIQKKIIEAANYLYSELNTWINQFYSHPLSVQTKKLSSQIDSAFGEIILIVEDIFNKINYCRNGFSLSDYLKYRKSTAINIKKMKSSYANNEIASFSLRSIPNPELYNQLVELRNKIAIESSLPVYMIFNNNTIKEICQLLPSSKEKLKLINGLGEKKIEKYGDRIISLVLSHCKKNNVDNSEIEKRLLLNKQKSRQGFLKKSDTVLVTLKHFKEGKNIEQIANDRGLSISTIENHIATAISLNLLQVEEVLPIEEVHKISSYFPKNLTDVRLQPIKEKAPPEISYGKLRMVLAWLQKKQNN
ncbi:helix-turn-helix domain-containing protein [Melioribacteraceae bacterium 4301-Me]|uniref:helix-turn-helix domain-containing protein n=1 Tax=Pyranulibacter aquaticus TaxID=3163344 RepID=UPI003599B05E